MTAADFPQQLVRTRRFALGVPGGFTVTGDGRAVLFVRERGGDDPVGCLWRLDLASGRERVLADPRRLGEAAGRGITGYATDRDGRLAVFALGGAVWAVDVDTDVDAAPDAAGGWPRRLTAAEGAADPRPDPAGRRIAYTCRGQLRVLDTEGSAGNGRALAVPDGDAVCWGIAPDAPRGHWWAPDGSGLLAARTDAAAVALWHLAEPAGPGTPPRTVRYAAVGGALPAVTLWRLGLDGIRVEARWDRDAFPYLPDAGWDAHGPYALVQSRDQRVVRLLTIGPDGGTAVAAELRDERWVHLVPGLPARTAAGALVWHVDRAGTRYLTVAGTAVTPPGLHLREVLGVEGEDVLFTATDRREPRETHLWTYAPGRGSRRLSVEPGVHTGVRRGTTLVHTATGADRPGGRTVVRRPGGRPVPVRSSAEEPLLRVRATDLVLGPRELRTALHLPSWYGPGDGPLPVLADPYGGPGRQRVTAGPDWRSLVSQWFAEHGFAVLVADGRGTPGRGPEWERAVHGDLLGPALEDQVTAVREAARLRPELDPGRVGIRGWSFGGSLAAWAVLRRPDVFHAAVAGAGVTDQRLYHARWRERFLGDPDEYPERYEAASLLRAAPALTRPLLLVHGLSDDRVHPAHTLRLSAALLAAGRPHEVLLLPGAGHQALGTPAAEHVLTHQLHFLRRHLGTAAP
ncbi:S9 family peptidase [Actinacidiphila acididurans]|uniref:Prolyl oligopeptidase family serine peptidase n=1 Tax=Actinacidiphila acididurans TaxID=2784346 RepID=A0ABS2TUJ9_9ACTN|nr:prolyl oligopeptidase family serine peptidase [Actinacidiphila acididurans]MBM9507006.1 prolyl oligopeptidase family serine peptidase [Actinacidiphila acididurans]